MEENKQENKQQSQGHVLTKDEIMKYAKASSIPLDSIITSNTKRRMLKKYDREAITTYLESPQNNEAKLREAIRYLESISPQFSQLLQYIPNMCHICPVLKQRLGNYSDKKEDKKLSDYYKVANYADDLNMREIGYKIIQTVYRDGIYYGIEVEDNYVKQLDPDRCKIIGESSIGLEIAFDFSMFNNNEYLLDHSYPKVFRKLYNDYQAGKKTLDYLKLEAKWQPLPVDITFVVKYNMSNLLYSLPPYINIFSYIYDLEDFRSCQKLSEEAKNFTMIALEIPQLPNAQTSDQYSVSSDMVDSTAIQLEDNLPQNMGFFTTALKPSVIKASGDNNSTVDTINNAVDNLWSASGKASCIFGVNNQTGTTLTYSIRADENELFQLYRQLERHWNYKVKTKNKNFRLQLLDVTRYSLKEVLDMFTSQATLGVPVLTAIPSLLGMDLSDVTDMSAMQEMLDIYENWRPLKSAYQTSSNDEGGRPKSDDKDLTENGEKSRDYK